MNIRWESARTGKTEEWTLHPTKAICVGRNYAAHANEQGHAVPNAPLLFMKPASALCGSGAAIVRPNYPRVDHEGELAVVIGKRAQAIHANEADDYILGYTCANDVTVRDLQREGGPWLRAKGMDSFLPIGPKVVGDLDASDLSIVVRVNGKIRQSGRTNQMVFSIPQILEYITQDITLEPHDLVLTGTPSGVGNLSIGDVVEVEIEGIGILRNPVVGR